MAAHGATQRASSMSPPASIADHDHTDEKKEKIQYNFSFMCTFSIPPSPEAAALQIIRNLSYFRLYFMLFVWVTLVITLVPERKESLIFLVAMSAAAYLYALILYLLPTNLGVPYKTIDKRIVFALLAIATMVELILTKAAIHLFVTLAATIPIILVLAALLRVGDDYFATEEACAEGETTPFVYKIIGDDAKVVDFV